jgi:ATP-binding cassette, subfamily B, multidrug efflux pump
VQLMGMLWPTLEFMLGIAMVIVLLVGGHQVLRHRITPGNFTAFTLYTLMLTWPMIAIGWVVNLFERGTASVMRIHELLVEEPTIDDRDAEMDIEEPIEGEIEFRHLSFSYGGANVLRDISLTIPAGSSLALVGLTGAGKTTLVNLIPRLYDAPEGMVLIDGRPVREYPLEVLRKSIGFVPQETFLFSETIRENILFGAPHATVDEMLEAAEAAHIRREFEEFPRGFETMVGERGLTLSGGQKQRSSLARALVCEPKILILDDALASVDTYTEERILEALRRRMVGRTTILISHRVSTVRNADRIAVLADGRIAELGTHEELLAREGYYFGLYEKQKMEEELAEVT